MSDGRLLETGKRQGAGFDESTMSVRTRVYLTGPDGRRNGYSLVPRFRTGGLLGIAVYDMTFRSDPGAFDTLEADDPGGLSVLDDGSIGLALFGGLIGYDPSAYRLKTRDGLVYHYEQAGGLRRVIDLNGNTLTFEADGIRHSSGQRISFHRDELGRISRIVDPNGSVLRYEYDAAGDLRRFSDQVTNITLCAYSAVRGPKAATNPWDSLSLEWQTPSPPPHNNFDVIPVVTDWSYGYGMITSMTDPANAGYGPDGYHGHHAEGHTNNVA